MGPRKLTILLLLFAAAAVAGATSTVNLTGTTIKDAGGNLFTGNSASSRRTTPAR